MKTQTGGGCESCMPPVRDCIGGRAVAPFRLFFKRSGGTPKYEAILFPPHSLDTSQNILDTPRNKRLTPRKCSVHPNGQKVHELRVFSRFPKARLSMTVQLCELPDRARAESTDCVCVLFFLGFFYVPSHPPLHMTRPRRIPSDQSHGGFTST